MITKPTDKDRLNGTKLVTDAAAWGLIQLEVTIDTKNALIYAISLAMIEHSRFNCYRQKTVEDKQTRGANTGIVFHWREAWNTDKDGWKPLPYELTKPEDVAYFVTRWMNEHAVWDSHEPDTDGSNNKGFRVTSNWTDQLAIIPEWITYGK